MRLRSQYYERKMMTVANLNSRRSIVAVVRVNNYDLAELISAVKKSLELIGLLNSIMKPGDKVFLKINHLSPSSTPEKGIVTHPVFVEAVITLLKEIGANITVGDDIEEGERDGFIVSGFRQMCDRQGVKLVNLREAGFVEKPCDGKILKNVYVSKIVIETDVVINLPKFKTYSLTTFTGGIKNMYGVIPAGLRLRFHADYFRPEDFAQMLVDIYTMVKPQLTIMDGVVAMEGEGPGSGKLRNLGLILASKDAVALDTVAGEIIGLKPEDVPTTCDAGERTLGISAMRNITVVGEKYDSIILKDFKLPTMVRRTGMKRAPHGMVKYILEEIAPRPQVKKKNCTACKECIKVCPTGAVTMVGKTAAINDQLCIRCMCCHEVCRFNAIYPARPFFGNIIYEITRATRMILRM